MCDSSRSIGLQGFQVEPRHRIPLVDVFRRGGERGALHFDLADLEWRIATVSQYPTRKIHGGSPPVDFHLRLPLAPRCPLTTPFLTSMVKRTVYPRAPPLSGQVCVTDHVPSKPEADGGPGRGVGVRARSAKGEAGRHCDTTDPTSHADDLHSAPNLQARSPLHFTPDRTVVDAWWNFHAKCPWRFR